MIKTRLILTILLVFTCIFSIKILASPQDNQLPLPSTGHAFLRQVNLIVNDTICIGDTVVLSAPDNMLSYLWSNDLTSQTIEVAPAETTWYWVEMLNQDSIVSRDSTLLTVYNYPEIISSSADTIVISGGNDTIVWVTVDEGSSVLWNTGSTDTEITVSPFETTTYTVEVSNPGHCSIMDTFLVIVNYSIDLEFTYDTVCQGDTTILINTTITNDSITNVLWDLDSDGQFNDKEGDTVKHVFDQSGSILVGMRIYFKVSPLSTTYNAVPVGSFPEVNFNYENTCENSTTLFNDATIVTSGRAEEWFWQFGDGKTDIFQNTSNYYVFPGTYTVQLNVISNYGCSDSVTKTITINELPKFNFRTSLDSIVVDNGKAYFPKGSTMTVSIEAEGTYDSIIWYNGSHEPSIAIADTGVYNATVYNQGCSVEARFIAAYSGGGGGGTGVEIMNLFTPNGDGYNDHWFVSNPDVTYPIKVTIYNRTGRSVYVSDDYQNDWNGQSEGNPLPQATYYYFIEDATGSTFKGPVTLIR